MRWTRVAITFLAAAAFAGCSSQLFEVRPKRPYTVVDQQVYYVQRPCPRNCCR